MTLSTPAASFDPGRDAQELRALEDLRHRGRRAKFPAWLEAQYEDEERVRLSKRLRYAILRTVIPYNAMLVIDLALTPGTFALAATLHFLFATPVMLIAAQIFAANPTRLWRDLTGVAIPLAIVIQILGVYVASGSPLSPHYLYFVTIALVVTNTTLRMSYRSALWATGTGFVLLAATQALTQRLPIAVAVTQCMAFAVCAYASLHCNLDRELDSRRFYLHQLRDKLRFAASDLEARRDALTGLANRRQLDETSARIWSRPDSAASPVALILLDIDRFKDFNDRYGHLAGDECLRRIGARVAAARLGCEGCVARFGGEEFLVLLPDIGLTAAVGIAEGLKSAILDLQVAHAGAVVTASFGVASGTISGSSLAALTAAADAALYASKRDGRNRVSTSPANWRAVA